MKKLYVNENLVAMGDYVIREVYEPAKYKLRIVLDSDYERDKNAYWNEQTTFYSNHKDYRFDGKVDDELLEKMRNQSKNDRTRYYAVYAYQHSGIFLYKSPYTGPDARWDSGLFGIAEVDNSNSDADDIFNDFFEDLKASMEGEVYGFQVMNELGDIVDSCYGFYGDKESMIDSGNFSASASVYKIIFNPRIQDYEEDFIMGGQCFDELNESSPEIANDPKFKQIYSWWKRYHLNDMHAGTEKQESALKDFTGDYNEQCAYLEKIGLLYDNGYKYGSSWLKREIPSEIQNQMRAFIKANGR